MTHVPSCPQSRKEAIDMYFLEHRAKLIDVAAFLDRLDRTSGEDVGDFREQAFLRAIEILGDGQPHRAKRILLSLSDHSDLMPQSAEGMKGAAGATPGPTESESGASS
ncbi:MAG: hypothetical protein VYE53_03630 [Planctomycetota bacterium]|nr:hypothetical protein [Planctomycetota bacterium]